MSARAVVAGIVMALGGTGAAAEPGGRWQVRPVLVFAPNTVTAARQTELLADAGVRQDLRLAVYVVTPAGVEPRFDAAATDADVATLRRRFDVGDDDFSVVLVGLDGGAKFSAEAPVSLDRLAATIEAMPMRREELRRRGS